MIEQFKFVIFDMDGTLLDSMQVWRGLGRNYLLQKGITPPEDLEEIINKQSMEESARYFIEVLGVSGTVQSMIEEVNLMVEKAYFETIILKEGVLEFLDLLKSRGVTMCVATATPSYLAKGALHRLGILEYFEFVLDCQEAGAGKTQPAIYQLAAKRMGCQIKDAVVFEDAPYAMKTAKEAGFYTVGIYDDSAEGEIMDIEKLCDCYVMDYKGLWE